MHTATRCDHEPVWTPAEPKPGTPLTPQFPEPKQDKPCCADDPLQKQVGGNHYKSLPIQPVEYAHANSLPMIEGNVVKYVTRHRDKGGAKDIRKAIHFLELLLKLEYGE
jgi:hypothetical protein